MKKITEKDSTEIESILKHLQNMPYGKDLGYKVLPPSANHLAGCVDDLIEILSQYINGENLPSFQQLQSLRDNQVRERLIDKKRNMSFAINGVDSEMECTVSKIQTIVSCFMKYIKTNDL